MTRTPPTKLRALLFSLLILVAPAGRSQALDQSLFPKAQEVSLSVSLKSAMMTRVLPATPGLLARVDFKIVFVFKNNTDRPMQFALARNWMPVLVSEDGLPLQGGLNADAVRNPTMRDFPVIPARATLDVPFYGSIFKSERGLSLGVWEDLGGGYDFRDINEKKYRLSFVSATPDKLYERGLENLGIAPAELTEFPSTPWVEIDIAVAARSLGK